MHGHSGVSLVPVRRHGGRERLGRGREGDGWRRQLIAHVPHVVLLVVHDDDDGGFRDITGTTDRTGVSTVAMGIGGFTFALIVGSIGDLITRNGVAETAYLQMMGELKEFLKAKSATKSSRGG